MLRSETSMINMMIFTKQDNLAGDNSTGQICQQANSLASQFGRKINKNNLPLLVLKQQQKSFVMSLRQLKRQLQLFS